ncbi:hypothetical protein [Streptomyces sp. NPDC048200]|uniref:hypothetical protein n=1 Tax=Streptomyces sp. NPDC048200 TaxID=3365512 RepID=UPI00372348AE
MAHTPVLDLRPGDQVAHLGGWFTLAALPAVPPRGDRLNLCFVGGARTSVHWLAHLTTRKEGS